MKHSRGPAHGRTRRLRAGQGIWLVVFACAAAQAAEPLRVASLNPVVTDIARQVGGEDVHIVEIVRPGQNPHAFAPTPAAMRQLHDAAIILAAGLGLETYIADFRSSLRIDQRLVELGASLPARHAAVAAGMGGGGQDRPTAHELDDLEHGDIDPHWWLDPALVQRAARVVMQAFADADPAHADAFAARYQDYARRLDALAAWARTELERVPESARKLATAHDAFGYFCDAFGFEAIPVVGLSTEEEPGPAQVRRVVNCVRSEHVRAIFPEQGANPKDLASIAQETGVRIGGRLLSGSPSPEEPTVEAMLRHNVRTIVDGLKDGTEP